ncbi:cytoplasm protein [Thecamonas trahens ATCC 50062]|uniref:Cytoplasm protein n=1 Tax=Thecamonas trahens ATCC 50062 TaxID=461836 RepID=A0A0L0DIZ6_THETB|nr:cytoplasm protein [Thecamonas trahens ATCC 50062]KNC52369.1 cytoplasm protein [Thecamonas trahens ATCC 50062]|eukprot:XP_013755416.1 cytoplasm protein [Thecamonas trahens ATCC 50062]
MVILSHDHARSRAYRWAEDGLGGWCNRFQNSVMALALWNGLDPILKERLFGVTGPEGPHGEDVKEYYFHTDGVPTHAYMAMLYKYPHVEFPYADLVDVAKTSGLWDDEYELGHALEDAFAARAYFDVEIEFAKVAGDDVFHIVTVTNRSETDAAPIHVLPHVWHRNTWSWNATKPPSEPTTLAPYESSSSDDDVHGGVDRGGASCGGDPGPISDNAFQATNASARLTTVRCDPNAVKPSIRYSKARGGLITNHKHLGKRYYYVGVESVGCDGGIERVASRDTFLFTDNETNYQAVFGVDPPDGASPYTKDAFHRAVVDGDAGAVNPEARGTKAACHIVRTLGPGEAVRIWVRYAPKPTDEPFADAAGVLAARKADADEFHAALLARWAGGAKVSAERAALVRRAVAGMLWTKSFFHFSVHLWLRGDSLHPAPPASRLSGRNAEWGHYVASDVLTLPDAWEYPWPAAWDLAIQCVTLALVDGEWAKRQLILQLRDWYMHPAGQLAAYPWDFGDVNPPVHAWAALKVYRMEHARCGRRDTVFLERVFHKLMLNFTWWVARKDADGHNVFAGGFLGLDNIGVFDRSAPLPDGTTLEQSDGTAWMALFCLNMFDMAIELALYASPAYEDTATKYFEHFVLICNAAYNMGSHGGALWDPVDGFFYDMLSQDDHTEHIPLKVRSFVGLIPIFAVTTVSGEALSQLPALSRRIAWFRTYRSSMLAVLPSVSQVEDDGSLFLSMVAQEQLESIMGYVLDEDEFLSPHGVRSLSRFHRDSPFSIEIGGQTLQIGYEPGVSRTHAYGGNSGWRGSVWFPVCYLLIDALRKHGAHYRDTLKFELPTRSGRLVALYDIADDLARRLVSLFEKPSSPGLPPVYAPPTPACFGSGDFADCTLFYEYFDGETGRGLGASHQTGWTGLVANLIVELAGGGENGV